MQHSRLTFNAWLGHFRVPPGLCFKTRVGAQPFIWKSFHSYASKTHFHKKGCAPSLILKVRVFGTRKWAITWTFKNWAPITLPTVKTTLAYIKRNHFLVHHRSPTSRGASDSYQQRTSQAYDI